jgi:hypothetical protein
MPADHGRITFRRPHVRNDGFPPLYASILQVLGVPEQIVDFRIEIGFTRDG